MPRLTGAASFACENGMKRDASVSEQKDTHKYVYSSSWYHPAFLMINICASVREEVDDIKLGGLCPGCVQSVVPRFVLGYSVGSR